MNYFKLLDVQENATTEEIKKSYHRKALEYHPDKLTGMATEFQQLGKSRMLLLNEAFRVLSEDSLRKQYLQALHNGKFRDVVRVCPHCHYSISLPAGAPMPSQCVMCHGDLQGEHKQSDARKLFYQSLLFWIQLSRENAVKKGIPATVEFVFSDGTWVLDQLDNQAFCLFTSSAALFNVSTAFLQGVRHSWDESCGAGFVTLEMEHERAASELESIFESRLEHLSIRVTGPQWLNPLNANVVYISSVCDVSLTTAQSWWSSCGENLAMLPVVPRPMWEDRIVEMSHILQGVDLPENFDQNKNQLSQYRESIRQSLAGIQQELQWNAERIRLFLKEL
jgi:curved DNA-binding protein CbpA